VKDQLNRTIQLKETPKRIVSLVPSQTELLVDLGLESSIIGITKFCVHPKQLRKVKTIVGGTKTVQLQKIKILQPDIIFCNKEENSQDIIESLESIAPVHISDIYNLEDTFELINMYSEIFKIEEKASSLIAAIQTERDHFQNQIQHKEQLKAAYFIWKNPWMVVASDTFIDCMLNESGFVNVFKAEKRYPEIDLDHSKLKEADVILLSSEPFPFKEAHVKELQLLFPEKTIKIVDGELFSWYGSRLLQSYSYFKGLHYLK
jgi:ABC-type Fe3+-hydroxamate transport system substrate-binding protein